MNEIRQFSMLERVESKRRAPNELLRLSAKTSRVLSLIRVDKVNLDNLKCLLSLRLDERFDISKLFFFFLLQLVIGIT